MLEALSLSLALCLTSEIAAAQSFTCPAEVSQDEREKKARELFDEALRREPADPRGALEILNCARRFADKPAVSLRIGTIAERLGKFDLAIEALERYLRLAGDAAPDRVPMRKHIESLREKLEESQEASSSVLPPLPKDEPKERSPVPGYLVAGGGGALLVVGGVLLYSAKKRSDDVHDIPPGTTYWNSSDAKGEIDGAKRQQTVGFIVLGAGAVAGAIGAYLIDDAKSPVTASAVVGKRSAQGSVRFAF